MVGEMPGDVTNRSDGVMSKILLSEPCFFYHENHEVREEKKDRHKSKNFVFFVVQFYRF